MSSISDYYADSGPERCGLILDDGRVVELENLSPSPEEGFLADPRVMIQYEDQAVATFHTHPGASSNLSYDDWIGMRNWPDLRHFIVGRDGVREYSVLENGLVVGVE